MQHLLSHFVLRLISHELLQNRPCFFIVFQDEIQSREIEIGLIEIRVSLYASLKFLFRFGVALLLNEENAQIVESVSVIRAQVDRAFQKLSGLIGLVTTGVQHSQTVISFRICGFVFKSPFEKGLCLGNVPLLPVNVSEI